MQKVGVFWEPLGKRQEKGGRGAPALLVNRVQLGLTGCFRTNSFVTCARSGAHSSRVLQTAWAGVGLPCTREMSRRLCCWFPQMYVPISVDKPGALLSQMGSPGDSCPENSTSPATSLFSFCPLTGWMCFLGHRCWVCCSLHWQQLLQRDFQRPLPKGYLKEALRFSDAPGVYNFLT